MTIINNLAGYGKGSGKTDEFGLPVFELDKCDNQVSLATHLNPASFMFPSGSDAMLVITNGVPSSNEEVPSANFYNTQLSPIAVGWKRGLAVIPAKLGVDKLSVMVRSPVAGYQLKYTVETIDESAVIAEATIDAGTDCGKNQVFTFPEQIGEGLLAIFVEVLAVPEKPACCSLVVAARVKLNDYSHEDYMGMPMSCDKDCEGCPKCDNASTAHLTVSGKPE